MDHFISPYAVTTGRTFSKLEGMMIWQKPASHQTSEEELRIASEIAENWNDPELKLFNILLEGDAGSGKTQLAKALSADLQLPYTKITCFADMDKSDIFGALLPVIDTDQEEDKDLLDAIYQSDCFSDVLQLIEGHFSLTPERAKAKFAELIQRIEEAEENPVIRYKYYPSEIVRAMEKGYLLEIQEPTVIRDASVLVALNSALEQNGMLNIPTGFVQRHPDCVVVITTNRNYQGNRPLNESLRDRMQHAEKMDLPPLAVMVARGIAKTGYQNQAVAEKMAEIIRLLDISAKANAIKGAAGMRSYFYWLNAVKQGQNPLQSIHQKVLYKVTTDTNELQLLQTALDTSGLLSQLRLLFHGQPLQDFKKAAARQISAEEANERGITDEGQVHLTAATTEEQAQDAAENEVPTADPSDQKEQEETVESSEAAALFENVDNTSQEGQAASGSESEANDLTDHTLTLTEFEATNKEKKAKASKTARDALKESIHAKEGLIVHRPAVDLNLRKPAQDLLKPLHSMIDALVKQTQELLENERGADYSKGQYTGTRFDASKIVYQDLRTFDKKNPPNETPSLAVAVRIDESGSMIREERIKYAQQAVLALTAFAEQVNIPLMIYGDTADASPREKTSLFAYKEFDEGFDFVQEKLMTMKPRQNNRDGAALRVLADRVSQQSATTKLLLNISDGQPKALPDYTGEKAKTDIQTVIADYERQGVLFLAAAIGQDKEVIKSIYGPERFIDLSQLQEFPQQLLQLLVRYL
ncbi:AAA family ATPase [Enterococcus sp. DIV0876]|uniref:AAA family ATPase n=1 Tax=Enterococcus sp. DIV0876 TaxID=2774633 RepID=UPI003D2FBFE6